MRETPLQLFNSLSGKKENFISLKEGSVKMFCCGPRLVDSLHLGNWRTYINQDLLRRVLEYKNLKVTHLLSLSDMQNPYLEPIQIASGTKEVTTSSSSSHQPNSKSAFQREWKKFNLLIPSHSPLTSEAKDEIIRFLQKLEESGNTVKNKDGLYFKGEAYPSGATHFEEMRSQPQTEIFQDFPLWDGRNLESGWESPWGKGFPHHHTQCAALAAAYLGSRVDIHCGGFGQAGAHHVHEMAQCESLSRQSLARYWVHSAWLLKTKKDKSWKMTKSSDKSDRLDQLLENGFSPLDFRYFCMTSHYRNYLTFSTNSLLSVKIARQKLMERISPLIKNSQTIHSPLALHWKNEFVSSCCDDLNFPKALSLLHLMIRDSELSGGEKGGLALEFDKILGLSFDSPHASESIDFLDLITEKRKSPLIRPWKKMSPIDEQYTMQDSRSGTQEFPGEEET